MKMWICPVCGYEMEAVEKPTLCPLCGYEEMIASANGGGKREKSAKRKK